MNVVIVIQKICINFIGSIQKITNHFDLISTNSTSFTQNKDQMCVTCRLNFQYKRRKSLTYHNTFLFLCHTEIKQKFPYFMIYVTHVINHCVQVKPKNPTFPQSSSKRDHNSAVFFGSLPSRDARNLRLLNIETTPLRCHFRNVQTQGK